METDSLLAMQWLSSISVPHPLLLTSLIADCRLLMAQPWKATTGHSLRESNSRADRLADAGCYQHCQEILYDTCSTFLLLTFGIAWVIPIYHNLLVILNFP